jgi:hypothetical protein
MDKFHQWQTFLLEQQAIALNLFIIAGVLVFLWWSFVRGRKWEKTVNLAVIGLFWLNVIIWGALAAGQVTP